MIILNCNNIPNKVECCRSCHENGLIHAYAFDNLSMGIIKQIPDIITIRLEHCCSQVHVVRELPRKFWEFHLLKNAVSIAKREDKPRDIIEDFLS